MKKIIKISCLPVAGKENPYQYLMMKGLNESTNLDVKSGIHDKFFGILRTAIIQKPDYIHFDWETSYYYRKHLLLTLISIPLFIFQVLFVKYVLKCNLVWTPHNLLPHNAKHLKIHKLCRTFFAKQMKWIRLFDIDAIERASSIFNVSSKKFIVVPEGSYVDYYPNEIKEEKAMKLLGLPIGKKVLLYIGLIKPYKGVLDLITAFNKIEAKEELILLIVGKAMDKVYLGEIKKNLSKDIVFIEGFIEDDQLQIYFNASDVVVLPFENIENSGSVVLAMGFEKPIIAPYMGVVSKRLSNQKELLYSSKKITTEILSQILSIPEQRLKTLGEQNKKNVLKYKWNDFSRYF
jgi:beta-1,4-mannosyltransferase